MIKIQNLTKDYGQLRAVDNISFTIPKGEIVGFLGPNGAGKTTTLKIMTCFMPPNSGNVYIDDLKFEGIISENPDKQSKFQVDSTGTQVQIFKEDNIVLDFIIGKTDQNYSHTFLRESESNKVYSVAGNLSYIFNKKVDQWRDKVIVDIPKDEIDYIEVSYADTTIYFTFVDTVWYVRQDDKEIEVEASKLSSILNAFSPMRTTKFQDEPIDVNWDKPNQTVVITLVDGTGYNLKFVKKDDKEVYIKASNKDNIFISSSYMMRGFHKKLQDFEGKK